MINRNADVKNKAKILKKVLPNILKEVTAQLQLVIGEKIEFRTTLDDYKGMTRKTLALVEVIQKVNYLKKLAPSFKRDLLFYELLNKMLRLSVRIPRDNVPIEYLLTEARKWKEVPTDIRVPEGLNYRLKHKSLLDFIHELVNVVNESILNEFLKKAFSQNSFIPQLQRCAQDLALPKALNAPPSKVSMIEAERLKGALRELTADWEVWVNLIYGLKLLAQGKLKSWEEIHNVVLLDKVNSLRRDKRLAPLAKDDWVYVRNSLDHGKAFFDPKGTIEFPHKRGKISWTLNRAFLEGWDIYLVNTTIRHVPNFVWAVRWLSYEPWITEMAKKSRR